jgi:hypothetical protein
MDNNKPVLKHVHPHVISFSTSISARISVVKHSNTMKASCAMHVITKKGTIFFVTYRGAGITDHMKKQQ